MKKFAKIIFVLALLVTFSATCWAGVSEEQATQQAEEIAGNVMSPFCPGRLLSDCPSGQAAELRKKIQERIASGEKKEQVLTSLYKLYGDELRAAPKTHGFGLVAWVAPFVFLALGLIGVLAWLKRKTNGAVVEPSAVLDAKTQARVDAELNS